MAQQPPDKVMGNCETGKLGNETVGGVGEYALVERILEWLAANQEGDVLVGVGDDGAVVRVGEVNLVITTDALIEGVHFRREWIAPEQLGWKALAVNLSDLAAMFAEPKFAVISLGLTGGESVEFVQRLYDGAKQLAQQFDVSLVGGDTVQSPQGIVVSITAIGVTDAQNPPLRSGAKEGDLIVATGSFGSSGLGLTALRKGREEVVGVIERHLMPRPRVREGLVAKRLDVCHAAIDVSDGLVSDLQKMAKMSRVGIELWVECIPIATPAREAAKLLSADPLEAALYGGEDYELLLAVPDEAAQRLCEEITARTATPATIIGKVTASPPGVWGREEGKQVTPMKGGYEHFRVS